MDYKEYVLGSLKEANNKEYCSLCLLLTHTEDKDTSIDSMQVSDAEVIDNLGDRLNIPTCIYDLDYLQGIVDRIGCEWRPTDQYYAFQYTVDHLFREGKRVKDSYVIIIKLSLLQYKALIAV